MNRIYLNQIKGTYKFVHTSVFGVLLSISIAGFTQTKHSTSIAVTTASNEARQLYYQAEDLENKLELDAAIALYKRALSLDSSFVLAYLRLAMIKDDFDNRKILLSKGMKHLDKVSKGEQLWFMGRNKIYGDNTGRAEFECFEELATNYPNDEHSNYLLANVYVNHGRHEPDSAIKYFKRAISINPGFSKAYNELAYVYMAKRQFNKANAVIKRYIAITPNKTNGYDAYAEMLMKTHKYNESIEAYENVLKIEKASPWAIIGIAANLNFLKKFQEARQTLLRLNDITLTDHEYRHVWRSELCSYLEEGKLDSAINVLKRQREATLSGKNTHEPLFHKYITLARLTRLHFEIGDDKSGLRHYFEWKGLVQTEFRNEQTIKNVIDLESYYKAYAAYISKNYTEALKLLDESILTDSNLHDITLLKAKIFLKQGKLENALTAMKELNQNNAYYLSWLAYCYQLMGREREYENTRAQINNLVQLNDIDFALRNYCEAIQEY